MERILTGMVVFDTETTGIEFGRDRIIEIGAVALENGAERGNFNALVRLPAGQMLPTFDYGAYRHYGRAVGPGRRG